jgi:hypothetical protein
MATLILETHPTAVNVAIGDDKLIVDLVDGRTIFIPLEWYPRLSYGSRKERQNWKLLGKGYAIHWPDLDEHIGIAGLVAGRRSGEAKKSFAQWLSRRRPKRSV